MRLILIRHGETVTSGRAYAGRSDVPLTDRGRAQAQGLAQRMADCRISLILSSPLSRAMDTARPLAIAHGLDPVPVPALMELDFGLHEGRGKAALGLTLRKTHARTRLPGGESLHETQGKIERWHQTLKKRILLENHYLPGDLWCQIDAFVDHYNHRRYHESPQNLTPADVYFGRGQIIIKQRERIKRKTIEARRLQHRKSAA